MLCYLVGTKLNFFTVLYIFTNQNGIEKNNFTLYIVMLAFHDIYMLRTIFLLKYQKNTNNQSNKKKLWEVY